MEKHKRESLRQRLGAARIAHDIVIDSFVEIYDFNDFLKSSIKREHELTSKRISKGLEGLEGEDRDEYISFFIEDYDKIDEVFEKLALESFIIMLYSRVETGMVMLCDALRQDKQRENEVVIDLRYSDLRGNGYIDQAKIYMKKVLGVDLDLGTSPQWPEIIALRELRNAIVHDRGWLQTKNATVKKHIEQGLLDIRKKKQENEEISGRIIICSGYIDFILPLLKEFFRNIKI